jgi:hypothetical protein
VLYFAYAWNLFQGDSQTAAMQSSLSRNSMYGEPKKTKKQPTDQSVMLHLAYAWNLVRGDSQMAANAESYQKAYASVRCPKAAHSYLVIT